MPASIPKRQCRRPCDTIVISSDSSQSAHSSNSDNEETPNSRSLCSLSKSTCIEPPSSGLFSNSPFQDAELCRYIGHTQGYPSRLSQDSSPSSRNPISASSFCPITLNAKRICRERGINVSDTFKPMHTVRFESSPLANTCVLQALSLFFHTVPGFAELSRSSTVKMRDMLLVVGSSTSRGLRTRLHNGSKLFGFDLQELADRLQVSFVILDKKVSCIELVKISPTFLFSFASYPPSEREFLLRTLDRDVALSPLQGTVFL